MDKNEQKKIFAQNLSYYTELSGKSKSEIAKLIGSLPSAYTSWIQGISLPRMDKIQALADLFSVSVSDLIEYHPYDYSDKNAELANIIRKDKEFADAVFKLSQLSSEEKATIFGTINLFYGKN